MIENKNILVTGATGFVAYHLVKKLSIRNTVYCIVRPTSNIDKLKLLSNVEFVIYDGSMHGLTTALSKLQIDLTYHLASLFIAEHNSAQIDDLINSNVLFPTQLLEVLANLKFYNFINTGTVWQTYTQKSYDPVCLYAATKEGFDNILEYYHLVKDLNCITLRLYDTYGAMDERKKLFWVLKKIYKNGESLDMSEGEQKINLVYIDDVVNAYELAGARLLSSTKKVNETFGVYSDREYSLREVITIFEQVYKCKLNINWGVRPYRTREIMQPPKVHPRLPSWECDIDLKDGIKMLHNVSFDGR